MLDSGYSPISFSQYMSHFQLVYIEYSVAMILLESVMTALTGLSTLQRQSYCPEISYPGQEVGVVTSPMIDEASGMVLSQKNPGVFWTLNDSQGVACVFAVALNGTLLEKLCLMGAENFDWEAITISKCTEDVPNSDQCIFIGDIGDNRRQRQTISIFKVEEPRLDLDSFENTRQVNDWTVAHFRYPQDQAHNAESLIIDPSTRDLLILTKSKSPPYSEVFRAPIDVDHQSYSTLEHTGIQLSIYDATDATISADGQVIIVRQYVGAFLWPNRARPLNTTVIDILKEDSCLISVGVQKQGESIGLNAAGDTYFTHSEFVNQSIWQYNILD